MLVYYFVPFIVSNRSLLFWVSNGHESVTVQNRTHVYMNFFHHKDLGNHPLHLCPNVVKHPVYTQIRLGLYIYRVSRRNLPDFGRVFLTLNYNDITQNTYIRSWTATEIITREKCGLLAGSTYCTWPGVPSALHDTRNQVRVCVVASAMRLKNTLLHLRRKTCTNVYSDLQWVHCNHVYHHWQQGWCANKYFWLV